MFWIFHIACHYTPNRQFCGLLNTNDYQRKTIRFRWFFNNSPSFFLADDEQSYVGNKIEDYDKNLKEPDEAN